MPVLASKSLASCVMKSSPSAPNEGPRNASLAPLKLPAGGLDGAVLAAAAAEGLAAGAALLAGVAVLDAPQAASSAPTAVAAAPARVPHNRFRRLIRDDRSPA